jgi:hypothetical protein
MKENISLFNYLLVLQIVEEDHPLIEYVDQNKIDFERN